MTTALATHLLKTDLAGHASCTCGARSAGRLDPDAAEQWFDAHQTLPAHRPTFGVGGKEAAETIGITYRQLDYWARTELLVPSVAAQGSGSRRRYSPTDIALGRVIAHIARAGNLTAARSALGDLRRLVESAARPAGIFLTDDGDISTSPPATGALWIPLEVTA